MPGRKNGLPVRSVEAIAIAREKVWQETHDEARYKALIKPNCFLCHVWFENDWWHYYHYGNACHTCTGRVISIKFPSKQHNNKSKITPDEAFEMLRIRREHVERNFLHLPPTERPAGFEPKPIPKEEILLIRVRLLGSGAAGWDFAGAAS